MGFVETLKSIVHVCRIAKRPSKKELWLSIKICFVGVSLLGVIGFVILFIGSMLTGFTPV